MATLTCSTWKTYTAKNTDSSVVWNDGTPATIATSYVISVEADTTGSTSVLVASPEEPEDEQEAEPEPLPDFRTEEMPGRSLPGHRNESFTSCVQPRAPPMEIQDRLNWVAYAGTERGKGDHFLNPRESDGMARTNKSATTISERYRQCLRELGVEITGELRQLRPLSRLVTELIPDQRSLLEARMFAKEERDRRKKSDEYVDILRHAVERVLCDSPTKTEAIRILEEAMRETTYSNFLSE